ncbi:VOC family protein [Actinomadura rupiterrae]|uniref:VOC family protein n=1 Tax=Actinomadura rupiterrae TaxID=559627 RepID=UPI0020A47131|nr:VOC family protein [Actinomadura rupiterrae]MCP2340281.1 hypothetical protein [Actinomadura rupiterrae]
MTLHWKLVVDANDPHAQARFWAAALGYEIEDHSTLIGELLDAGIVDPDLVVNGLAWRDAAAVRHPDDPFDKKSGVGQGRRLLFNRVPETKSGKNRLHIDVHDPAGDREAAVERLRDLGAGVQRRVQEMGGEWVVMTDPEGNEFCVH